VQWTFQSENWTYYNTSFEITHVNSFMLETETPSETLDCYSIIWKWLIARGNFIASTLRMSPVNCWTQNGKSKDQVVHVHAIKEYGESDVQLHSFFTSALDIGGQLYGLVTEIFPRYLFTSRGLVVPTAFLGLVEKSKSLSETERPLLLRPARGLVTLLSSLSGSQL
jgi:hypothetical protein